MDLINATQKNKSKLEHWENAIHAWRQSGKSQVQYCEETGLNLSTFGYWRKKIGKPQSLLIPVKVQETKPAEPILLRIETPQGMKVFLPCDANLNNLSTILKLLGVMQ